MAKPKRPPFLLKLQVVHSPQWMQLVRKYINWIGFGILGVVFLLVALAATGQPEMIYVVYIILGALVLAGASWRIIDMRVKGYVYLSAQEVFIKQGNQKPVRVPLQPPLLVKLYVVPPSKVTMKGYGLYRSLPNDVESYELWRFVFDIQGQQHVLPVRLWKQDFERLQYIVKLWYQTGVHFEEYLQDNNEQWLPSRMLQPIKQTTRK